MSLFQKCTCGSELSICSGKGYNCPFQNQFSLNAQSNTEKNTVLSVSDLMKVIERKDAQISELQKENERLRNLLLTEAKKSARIDATRWTESDFDIKAHEEHYVKTYCKEHNITPNDNN